MKSKFSLSPTPFTDLMLNPEKLEAALKMAKHENDAFEASRRFGRDANNSATANGSAQDKQNQTSPE
jgi:hypothetical protein